ncbi:MAG: hypothetical protein ACREVN_12775 [Gammaproteobacteria bacterium]
MRNRRKKDRRKRDKARKRPQPPDGQEAQTSRTGRIQIKDGRHNVWDTSGLDDTQKLMTFLHNPELELEDDQPPDDGEPGNPYNSTGSWALRKRKPRDS